VQFLLIGPIWLMSHVYRRLGFCVLSGSARTVR
jgi:hypothetical protein